MDSKRPSAACPSSSGNRISDYPTLLIAVSPEQRAPVLSKENNPTPVLGFYISLKRRNVLVSSNGNVHCPFTSSLLLGLKVGALQFVNFIRFGVWVHTEFLSCSKVEDLLRNEDGVGWSLTPAAL